MTEFAKLLSDELTKDLEWREAELAILRKQLVGTSAGEIAEQVMLRTNVTLVYAHYEGFCKFALELYVDALEKLKLKRAELNWALATLSMKKFRSNLIKETDSLSFFTAMFAGMNDVLGEEATYERPPQIANLWPDLLISWFAKLGLNATEITTYKTLLTSLVDNRNMIAHGRKLTIGTRVELDKYSHAALMVMHFLALEIVTAVESKGYKRIQHGQTAFNQALGA